MIIRPYEARDLGAMIEIWNEVVVAGDAFPQENTLDLASAGEFFAAQSLSAVAEYEESDAPNLKNRAENSNLKSGEILGLYILHPNNVGRCAHIANASYAVASRARGLGVGEKLVRDSIKQGAALGFGVLQFNAVVEGNLRARRLYERLGFTGLGVIPRGFRMKDGTFANICPYYIELRAVQI